MREDSTPTPRTLRPRLKPGAVRAYTLLELIAAWAILTGIAEITAAIRLRKEITREWTIALAGAFAVAFGVALIALPVRGALAMVLWVGAYAVAAGVLLIGLAVQLRGWDQDHPGMAMS